MKIEQRGEGRGGRMKYMRRRGRGEGLKACLYEVSPAFLRYLDEGVTRHVLHSIMSFMHELKQLVHHCLQELPVRSAEGRGGGEGRRGGVAIME